MTSPSTQGAPPPSPSPRSGMPGWAIALIVAVVAIPLVVVLLGVVASLGIYGVRRYLSAAKSAEARASIGMMAKDAAAAYDRERAATEVTDAPPLKNRLCASASASVPDSASKIQGRKYMSSPGEWQVDAAQDAGFACLRFSLSDPQYYMYSYRMDGPGGDGSSFSAIANGDLNGDGVTSEFLLTGSVSGGVLTIKPTIEETMPME